ncbi:alpha-E domain-containing protein [Formosa sp. S-31]|uniref:alpha-E domain-containing protein n=1 Tax=Formosa sp. S-31 TaxID=2790949 RepID=UPI003EC0429F
MLARVANNLFWMGRYIERSEHLARYLNVNYFSSLDAPDDVSQSRQFVFRSIMYMSANDIIDPEIELKEEDVLYNVGLNKNVPYSIISSITNAYENARSSRDLISTELFESINKIRNEVKNYPVDTYLRNGLYDLTTLVTDATSGIRTKIRSTLLHDEVYAIIMLGIYLERAMQVSRIINSKVSDASAEKDMYSTDSDNRGYQWSTLLKCVSSYDMMRRLYKKTPKRQSALEFIILNKQCPRSIKNCLNEINKYISIISKQKHVSNTSASFLIAKMKCEYDFKLIEEIDDDLESCIGSLVTKLETIAEKLEEDYFNISNSVIINSTKKTEFIY